MSRSSHGFKYLVRQYWMVLQRLRAGRRVVVPLPSRQRRWTGLDPLEPRLLFSVTPLAELATELESAQGQAAVMADWQGTAVAEDEPDAFTGRHDAGLDANVVRHELVFVDGGIEDYQDLVSDLLSESDDARRIDVVVLDADRDGIEQISAVLSGYADLDAVHILSHGDEAGVQLGSSWLDGAALDGYAGQIAGWADALEGEADLLFYGCNLAGSAEGVALVDELGDLTGADVAASDDLTGSADLGGDWDLEFAAGAIETDVVVPAASQASWQGVLATETVADDFSSGDFTGSTGTQSWNGDWIETNDDGSASGGTVYVQGGMLDISNVNGGAVPHIARGADLAGASVATLTFDFDAYGTGGLDKFVFEVSDDGGSNYTVLETLDVIGNLSGSRSFDLQDSISLTGDVVVRFRIGQGFGAAGQHFAVDNVQIAHDGGPNVAPAVNDQSFGVAENSTNGTSVGTVVASDPNGGDTLTYAITGGTGQTAFAINSSTGEITVADSGQLDYESASSFTLAVEVADDGSPNLSDTATITVNLNDVNDVTPTITPGQSFGVAENAANTTSVGTVVATDPDTVGSLTGWTIVSGNGDGIFQINASTGEITVADNTNLDYESVTSYALGIQVGDGTNTSATETVTVNVTDVNDVTPTITAGQSWNVAEDAANTTSVGTVVATDPDTVGSLTGWTIVSGNGDGIFQINSSTGEITIADNTNLDYESATSYVLGIQVGDGTNTSATETVTVNVTDVNDVTPTITAGQSWNVAEDAANTTSVGTVAATDPDTVGSLTGWTIVSGNGDGIFQINASTGEITVADNTNLDYESATSYVLGIQVGDGTNTSATETVTVNVTDVNDVTPTITAGQSWNVAEDAANTTSVGTVAATDPDTVGSLTGWTIVSGNGDGIFQINASTGEITVADNTNLDYESATSYVLGIQVGDGTNTSATETVTVNVTDVNDVTPTITAGQSWNVAEDAANTTSVGTVAATDPDTVGSLTGWTIVSGNGDGIFQINASTGEITVADNTNLDYESATSYVLGIQVGDGTNTSATETVTVNVTDVNDVTPTITAGQSWNVAEDAANTTSVGTVAATDPDTVGSLNGWTIVSGNGDGIFQINSSTGEITVADNTNLDYESATSYVLGIQVGDGTNTSATETVTINVTDVNDVTPTITAGQSWNVAEDAANTTSVGTVAATDPDTVGSLTGWTIVSGNGDGIFQINSSTGEITIADNTNLDYESATSYVLGIQVGDGTNTSATETVTVNVTDVNDVTPTITAGQNWNVAEDAANSTSVGTVAATDPDTVGSMTGWTIVSGNADGIFQINSSTGEITVADNTNLDYESATSYVLGIQVGDGTNTSATETVTINVTDVNDVTPTITAGQSWNVAEDAANTTSVGTVAATDPDTVGSLSGWTIVSGNGDGIFQINSSTGEITIGDNTNLDYESATSYVLGIQVGDGTNTSATETVTVNVTDVNDVTPTITAGQSWNVAEDAANTTSVGTVAATDPDTVGSLTGWTIVSGNGDGIFQINSSTGEITVADNTNLDYESATSYVLGIQVGDGTNTSATETVTVNVTDVNDVTPTITAGQSWNVAEDAANTTSVGTVAATDPDTVGSLTGWTIVSGNGDGIFQINASTGEITVADNTNLDYESATSYVLGIQVGDGANTSATETVTVNVTDVNDVTPTITADQSWNVAEDAANTTSVGTVVATDPDTVGSLTGWTIVSGNGDGIFQINSSTGEITITDNTNLDYESGTSYVLGIQVGDGTNTSATETVTINVTDVNDVTPTITPGQSFGVAEDAANTTSVGTVVATDPDTVGSLTGWTIVSGNGAGIFQINSSTGEITIADNTNLDYESATSYVLGVQVGDGTNTSATETVTINVTDVNDSAPVITPGQSFGVAENAANATTVGTVAATDPETDPLSGWTIVSGNGDGIFQINSSTGEITIADNTNLDYESATSYVLGIQVGDGTNTSASETVTVNITDVNDVTPTITAGQSWNVAEDAANTTSVGPVAATDPDTVGSLTGWTIVSGNGDGIFQINASTGEITIADNTNLDYESGTSYVLGIQVGDGTNTSATESVTINVTDVNDVTPSITAGQSWNVAEDAANTTSVGTVAATDPDTVGSLTGWTIVSGNGDGIFQINSSTGEITIADNTNLDYESATSYVLGIQVGDGTHTSATESVTINVTDVNDVTPTITAGQSWNVAEDAANTTSVGTVAATDPDTVGSLTGWSIVSGNGDGIFQINSSTGEITVADNTNLDYESATSYVLGVQVGDGVNTSATETVTVNVTDANDVTPTITAGQSWNVAEDAANTTSVGTVAATDPDTVGSLTGWTIVSGNGDGIFQINSSTGEITIADNTNLDYESATSYILGIQVGDGTNTSATETVTVNVTDLNDVTPTITAGQSWNVAEDAANTTSVGTVAATDPDTVGSLTGWTIVSGNGDGIFQINSSTGEITIADNTNLDYESATSYVLGIQVGDGTNTSATESVTINVTDVNDVTPTITAGQSWNVAEDAANTTSVGTVAATDPDTVGSLTGWSIVSGNGDGIFQINASTGEITVADNTNLDYESATSYALGVQVGDGTNTSATETVTINVTDVNDVTPTITPGQSFGVAEDAANTTSVGTVAATDPDTVGSLTGWTIVSGNGDGIFQINSSTGEITIADNTNLDYESATSYVLGVQVGDGVNTSATETVTVNVTDVNDVTPTVTPGQSFGVAEDAANTTSVGTVVATDPDTVGSLTGWTIVSGNGDGTFQINSSTGEITIADNTNLDYESATSYVLGVQVGDGANTSATETVTINVTDVNDVTPTITPGQSFGVAEDAANTTSMGTVVATDPDTVGSLTGWTIVSGNGDGIFQINASTGEITVADNMNLDYESATSYVLGVQVGDGVNTSATETVTINVTDVNDVTPTITPGQSFGVAEDAANTTSVGTVAATDPDTIGSLTGWTIVSGNGAGIFQINSSTGEITIADNTNLDYEAATTHVLGVQVDDGINVSAVETVTINVTNVDEMPTTTGLSDVTVDEDSADSVVDLHAAFDDPEDGSAGLDYSLLSNTNGALLDGLAIDNVAGTLTLDYAPDVSGTALLTIRATDTAGQTIDATFSVTVQPVNDAPTLVANEGLEVDQAETITVTSDILEATDVDNAASQVTFTLTAMPEHGTLKLDGVALEAGDSFTQDDIDSGRVTYEHDAGFTTTDAFTFTVSDGSGGEIGATVSLVSIRPVTTPTVEPPPVPEPPAPPPVPEVEITPTPLEDPTTFGPDTDPPGSSDEWTDDDAGTSEPAAEETPEATDPPAPGPDQPGVAPAPDGNGSVIGSLWTDMVDLLDRASPRGPFVLPSPGQPSALPPQTVLRHMASANEYIQSRLDAQTRSVTLTFGTAAGLSSAMYIGYTAWAVRGGSLLASVLSVMPVWRMLDPLPILDGPVSKEGKRQGPRTDDDDTERRLGRILG